MRMPAIRIRRTLTIRSLMIVVACVAFGIVITGILLKWRHHWSLCMEKSGYAGQFEAARREHEVSSLKLAQEVEAFAEDAKRRIEDLSDERFRRIDHGKLTGKIVPRSRKFIEDQELSAKRQRDIAASSHQEAEAWANIASRFRQAAWRPWSRLEPLENEFDRRIAAEQQRLGVYVEELEKSAPPETKELLKENTDLPPSR
jgi:hypothetical protein